MDILKLLEQGEVIFAADAVESKKMKALVESVNKSFTDMSQAAAAFAEYASSQLKGEEHHKIVHAKSLVEAYPSWNALKLAYAEFAKEEGKKIAAYNATKAKLITNLNTLLKETTKEPAVSLYDIFEGDFKKCEEGHEVVILGEHGKNIINTMIESLDAGLVVSGHFDEIEPKQLDANYANVEQNVAMCKAQANEMYANKFPKLQKAEQTISIMEEVGKKIVFFVTYQNDLLATGLKQKELLNFEKNLTKQYIPLKKSLQKELRVSFVEICDIVVDETTYPTADIENPPKVEEYVEEAVEEVEAPAAEEVAVEAAPVAEAPTEVAEAPVTEEVAIDTDIDDIE